MCGYYQLAYLCCNQIYGFSAEPETKCPKAISNKRFCRTGASSSWVIQGYPLTTGKTCEDCDAKAKQDPEQGRQRRERQMRRTEDEERNQNIEERVERLRRQLAAHQRLLDERK